MKITQFHVSISLVILKIFYVLSLRERGRERKRHRFGVPLIGALIGRFLYVPSLGTKPATSAYWDDALTERPSQSKLALLSCLGCICTEDRGHMLTKISKNRRAGGELSDQQGHSRVLCPLQKNLHPSARSWGFPAAAALQKNNYLSSQIETGW